MYLHFSNINKAKNWYLQLLLNFTKTEILFGLEGPEILRSTHPIREFRDREQDEDGEVGYDFLTGLFFFFDDGVLIESWSELSGSVVFLPELFRSWGWN